jgi:hypothetical protein
MLQAMDSLTATSLALRPPGWPAGPAAAAAEAGRQAAAWFNSPVVEGSQVLRAPVHPGVGDAGALLQRFLGSLQDNPQP